MSNELLLCSSCRSPPGRYSYFNHEPNGCRFILENFGAYREEVPVVGIVIACTEWEYKIASTEPSESSLLTKDRADMSAALVDDFESVQVRRVLLSHEINNRNFSRTQHAQEIVIISARDAAGKLDTGGADGSLKKRRVS
jgi:hypothetical protein